MFMRNRITSHGLIKARCSNFFHTEAVDLPRLPIPSLEKTEKKLTESLNPFIDYPSHNFIKRFVEYGSELQSKLVSLKKGETNWLYDWWLEEAYLKCRNSLVINSNPGIMFPTFRYNNDAEYIKTVALVIKAIQDFKKAVINKRYDMLEKASKHPLCFSQYNLIFNNCRVPMFEKDEMSFITELPIYNPEYIVVMCNNKMWRLEILVDEGQLQKSLEHILHYSQQSVNPTPINILTASNDRNLWAKHYKLLQTDVINKEICHIIRTSLCILCLDQQTPNSNGDDNQNFVANNILHGNGSKWNTGNRWFDKTLQVITDRTSGKIGINYEHTVAEGGPYFSLLSYITQYIQSKPNNEKQIINSSSYSPPKLLTFSNLTRDHYDAIEKTTEWIDDYIDSLQLCLYKFVDFGTAQIKQLNVSPDAFIQLALQLAYFRLHKECCATYESASTRKFFKGRTETIRSCTLETLNFCRQFILNASNEDKDNMGKENLRNLALKAMTKHSRLTKEAMNGEGIDRHILGLRKIAEKYQNGHFLELLKDPLWIKSTYFSLSTSQISNPYDSYMFYGPLQINDGKSYGFCYNPDKTCINYAISLCNTLVSRESRQNINIQLARLFTESMIDVRNILI